MQRPNMSDVLSEAWEKYKKNLGILIGAYFIIWMLTSLSQLPLNIVSNFGSLFINDDSSAGAVLGFLVILLVVFVIFYPISLAVSTWLGIGERNILLAATDDKQVDFGDLFKTNGLFWRYLGSIMLVGLIVVAGFFLFIIPGIYFAIRFMFVTNAIVDKRISVSESLTYSSKLTLNNKWYLIGWGLLMFGINFLGFMALLVGLIFTIPFTAFASMVLYRHLTNNVDQHGKLTKHKNSTSSHPAHVAK